MRKILAMLILAAAGVFGLSSVAGAEDLGWFEAGSCSWHGNRDFYANGDYHVNFDAFGPNGNLCRLNSLEFWGNTKYDYPYITGGRLGVSNAGVGLCAAPGYATVAHGYPQINEWGSSTGVVYQPAFTLYHGFMGNSGYYPAGSVGPYGWVRFRSPVLRHGTIQGPGDRCNAKFTLQ